MPSPTLLECFDKYIPDHIFKDIVFELDPICDNCCIIVDGCGAMGCYRFTEDEPHEQNLVLKRNKRGGVSYLDSEARPTTISGWLCAKVWFVYKPHHADFETEEVRANIVKECIYNIITMHCDRCQQTKYSYVYYCLFCHTCDDSHKFCKYGPTMGCLQRLCLDCFTEDPEAIDKYDRDNKTIWLTYKGKTVKYTDTRYSGCTDSSSLCWKHNKQN